MAVTATLPEIEEPIAAPSRRIPALDGLRGIAILLVLLRHAVFGFKTTWKPLARLVKCGQLTWSGVDLFFVLSGFLIGGILLDARDSPNYFKTFYARRAYRILPLYGVVTAIFLLRYLPFHWLHTITGNLAPLFIPAFAYLTLTQNFWMFSNDRFGPEGMTATWSLAVEEQFYLTMPFLIRKLKLPALVTMLIAIVVAAPLLRFWLNAHVRYGDFGCYVLTPCRADALCLGVLVAVAIRQRVIREWFTTRRTVVNSAAFVLLLGVVVMTVKGYSIPWVAPTNTWGYSWLALFYTTCLIIALTGTGWSQRLLTNKVLMWLGTVAYCTYLIHMFLIQSVRLLLHSLPYSWRFLIGGFSGVAAALAIAVVSWKYFEKPLLRRGQNYSY